MEYGVNCVAYIRVSDQQQTRGDSLADQERSCREFAQRAGWKVVRVYRDDGKSAWKDDIKHRPQFGQMLAAARSGAFQAVVVYKLDRFARKARIYHTCRWQLEQAGVQLVSATEPNEPTAAGRLSSGMLAEFAEFYSAQLSERIRGAALSKAARGLWVGPAPFGYELRDRRLVPGPLRLWVVAIFVGYDLGASTVDISVALNAAGIPLGRGKPWTKDSVLMILRNHAYIGRAGGRALAAYEAGHTHLVSPDLWERVQATIGTRRKRPRGPRQTSRPAPLPWRALCALCGGSMHRHPHGTHRYLHCRASLNKTCAAKGVRLDLVEAQLDLLKQAGAKVTIVWLKAPRGIERFE
jgi:site-specific DNA recombinase